MISTKLHRNKKIKIKKTEQQEPHKNGCEIRFSRLISSSCSTSGICRSTVKPHANHLIKNHDVHVSTHLDIRNVNDMPSLMKIVCFILPTLNKICICICIWRQKHALLLYYWKLLIFFPNITQSIFKIRRTQFKAWA